MSTNETPKAEKECALTGRQFEIVLTMTDRATANMYANELESALKQVGSEVIVTRRKEESETMDLGGTIGIVVASAAATAVANGIADWLRKRQSAKLTIKGPGGELLAENLSSSHAVELATVLKKCLTH